MATPAPTSTQQGALYQLWAVPGLKTGTAVHINGPYDEYGIIQACLDKPFPTSRGHRMLVFSHDGICKPDPKTAVLYLIRGMLRKWRPEYGHCHMTLGFA